MHDVVVIGAGHAAVEAALAAARMGCRTLVLTLRLDAVGRMSCNPAIGGLAKGQIVREIDALGGEMGRAIDATGIQFRTLNTGKGPAVRSPRAQADKYAYSAHMRRALLSTPGISVLEEAVGDLLVEDGVCVGVRGENGTPHPARAVVVTTGTFLRSVMHCGEVRSVGGRFGEPSADRLSGSLRRLGFELGRLKTGTPPRLARESLDFRSLKIQHGDPEPRPFSHSTERIEQPQTVCWITHTGPRAHEIIRANLHRAPMYTGQIASAGPRYCPSIEDKVVRFADKDRHMIFLEPESLSTNEIYCNGISTSLPPDVQDAFVRTIPGLERAEILRHGYAVEYDYVPPHQLQPTLETRTVRNLYFAGQINGTSGYEEAAGQGILAGINAARRLRGGAPVVLRRDQAYIGVMIDDLISMEHREPYRMFTSRAEYRLLLRADNADRRLTPIGHGLGLVSDAAARAVEEKEAAIAAAREDLRRRRREAYLRRPEVRIGEVADLPREVAEQVEIEVKYEAYIGRQRDQIERLRRFEEKTIPRTFDFARVRHLRNEARDKLERFRPATIGQASRIAGVTPADVQLLLVHLGR